MKLEELIYKRLTSNVNLIKLLTKYSGIPAVFYQQAPADDSDKWDIKQYPRIDYVIDLQANSERKSAGVMQISIWSDETSIPPEDIEPLVRDCLVDIFVQPDNQPTYCFSWAKTEAFDIGNRISAPNTKVFGMDIIYDILSFTNQVTYDPDPILAISKFVREVIPEAMQIGIDNIDNYFKASIDVPAFYFSLNSANKVSAKETYSVCWIESVVTIHVFGPNPEDRLKWCMLLANKLSVAGEVIMLDESPMQITSLKVNNKADYLTEGQLYIGALFGILKYKAQPNKIQGINIKIE